MTDLRKLLPCPFCRGKAVIERKGTTRQSMIIACEDCGGRVESDDVYGCTEPERLRWNRRARIDAALSEPVEPVAIGEVKESGVVWANQNPHAYPIGTKFYTAPADQWRRVEDAPDTARMVEVTDGVNRCYGNCVKGHLWNYDDNQAIQLATHWRDLPALPEGDK